MSALLSAVGLVVRHGGVAALAGVDLEVSAGEFVAVVGPNGAGKTTLVDCLSGHRRPDAGRVSLDGHDATAMSAERRARRGVARTFQDARLFPSLSVTDTLLLAQEPVSPTPVLAALLGLPRWRAAERRRLAMAGELAQAWGLESSVDRPVGELSTGIRRLVDLAGVMARKPRLLLLDEPTAGLAGAEAAALAPSLRRVCQESGAGAVIVEHDLPLVWGLADRVVVMEGGQVVAAGRPDELRDHPALSFGSAGRHGQSGSA